MSKLLNYIVADALTAEQKQFKTKITASTAKFVLKVHTSRGVLLFAPQEEYKANFVSKITGNPVIKELV